MKKEHHVSNNQPTEDQMFQMLSFMNTEECKQCVVSIFDAKSNGERYLAIQKLISATFVAASK